jgi:DNA-binding transcriptional LysR family regulator
MEIRHLKTFKTIVETGGFTKAADKLGYAQSTITSHMKSLEDELGQPLFDRIGKQVILTKSGKQLLPYAKQMIQIYKDIKEVTSNNGEIRGDIVISAPEALLTYRFPPIIKEFKGKYPNVNIELHHLDPLTFKEDLSAGNVDVAFILGEEVTDSEFKAEKLNAEQMMFLYPNGLDWENTSNNILYTEKGCSYRFLFDRFMQEQQIPVKASIEYWSIEAIKQSVIGGLGISMLPLMTVEKELKERELSGHEYLSDEEIAAYLIYHKNKWLSPAVKAFIEVIRKHV